VGDTAPRRISLANLSSPWPRSTSTRSASSRPSAKASAARDSADMARSRMAVRSGTSGMPRCVCVLMPAMLAPIAGGRQRSASGTIGFPARPMGCAGARPAPPVLDQPAQRRVGQRRLDRGGDLAPLLLVGPVEPSGADQKVEHVLAVLDRRALHVPALARAQ